MADIAQMVTNAAARYGVDPAVALRLAQQESGLDPQAVSPAGAEGVMQLIPSTAAQYGVSDPYDPTQNIDAGVRYLRDLIRQFGDTVKGVAAYNWGMGHLATAIGRYGEDWLSHAPAETKTYVFRILGVTSPTGAPATVPPVTPDPLVIDSSTGLPIEDLSSMTLPAGATDGELLRPNILLLAALAVGALVLVEVLND